MEFASCQCQIRGNIVSFRRRLKTYLFNSGVAEERENERERERERRERGEREREERERERGERERGGVHNKRE